MTGLTRHVAEWIAGLGIDQVPEIARNVLRHAVLDTLACGLHGRSTEWAGIVEDWARGAGRAQGAGRASGGGPGDASIWGDGAPALRAEMAALVNGISCHAFELDDYHPTKLHPGAVVVPAALAVGEKLDASGEDLMAAIAAGYEVMIRTSAALDPSTARLQGWHITGVTGTFGAATACARLLGLDGEKTSWALGIAGTQSSGLFAFNADGAMTKRFHAGDAARAGVVAAELAAAGFTGPTQIFEAEDGGFLKAHSSSVDEKQLRNGLGAEWRLENTAFKPYSCCGSLHAYIDAALELRARFGEPGGRRVRIGLPRVIEVQCGYDYAPGTALNAQMSSRFCVATALRHGQVLPGEFSADCLADPETVALAGRIEQSHDPALDDIYPANFCGWVELESEPGIGDFARAFRQDPSGSPANPEKDQAMIDKFRRLAGDIMASDQTAKIERAALALEATDARALVATLATRESAAAE
ncbi:MAG: MmgE/PrpD family protein [Alphaproteobacteria bacterium]|nr:MmgE/PrpD family protein [Alphaproteobacteria bacterium]